MIDHIGFEVSDLGRSARFYDAVFYPLGARRTFDSEKAIAYGTNFPTLWIVVRGRPPAPGYGHVALTATGPPGERPQYGPGYYAAYLRDPDGLRVEVVSRR
jgi:catechol 2,3-dioxygenase-like lactoylglutathione lyase family enzyme